MRKKTMKISFILGLAILPIAGLFMTTCHYDIFELDLTVVLDKTEAKVGDTVIATAVLKSLLYKDYIVELPYWLAAKGGKNKEDILYAVFTSKEDFNWSNELASYCHEPVERPKILLNKDSVVKRKFEYKITSTEDMYVHVAVFFHLGGIGEQYGLVWTSDPKKIKVVKEQ